MHVHGVQVADTCAVRVACYCQAVSWQHRRLSRSATCLSLLHLHPSTHPSTSTRPCLRFCLNATTAAATTVRRRYQGHVSAALVLGGVDFRGPHLFTVYPHGSTDSLPYCTMGSGSLNAMAVFESGYKDDLTREEAMDLVARAIRCGTRGWCCAARLIRKQGDL